MPRRPQTSHIHIVGIHIVDIALAHYTKGHLPHNQGNDLAAAKGVEALKLQL